MPFKNFSPDPAAVAAACQKPLHPDAELGIKLYNEGKYFEAHEALEAAWRVEGEPSRRLYQGILQAGIAFMHAHSGYTKGVFSMFERCRVWLAPWPDHCRTIDVGKLKADVETLVAEVKRLGPEGLDELNQELFTKIRRV